MVGLNESGTISHSFAHAYIHSLVALRPQNSHNVLGGLVGRVRGGTISNSYAVGSVSGHCQIGGLIANANGLRIEDSYARVNMTRLTQSCPTAGDVGALAFSGFVGALRQSNIVNSYAAGRRSGNVRGLVERVVTPAPVTNSYWDNTLNGNGSTRGSGLSTSALQMPTEADGIYASWNSDSDDWDFGNSEQYPTLRTIISGTDGTDIATRIWDDTLLRGVSVSDGIIIRSNPITNDASYRNTNRYNLYVDNSLLPKQISLNTTPSSIPLYCDGVRCGTSGSLNLTSDGTQLIRMDLSSSNRFMPYYFDVLREDVTLNNVATINLNEGDTFMVSGDYSGSSDINWVQTSGSAVTHVNADRLNLRLTPQADLVAEDAEFDDVRFRLAISVDDDNGTPQVYLSREITARINKVNNAPTTGDVRLVLNSGRFTISENLSDPDGGNIVNIERQFQRRPLGGDWADIDLAESGMEYTLPAETIAYQYRLISFYTDGQGYTSDAIISNIVNVPADTNLITDIDGDSIPNNEDIDDDGDGLIEIRHLEDVDAIRYQLDGSGYRASADAALNTLGCPSLGCIGYELVGNLNFDDASSYRSGVRSDNWRTPGGSFGGSSQGWPPIGGAPGGDVFNATFNGNGYVISRLTISNPSAGGRVNVGLFSEIGENGKVENLGLSNVELKGYSGNKSVGSIAGMVRRGGVVRNSYVTADAVTYEIRTTLGTVGGLVGINEGYILNSYANATVSIQTFSGPISAKGDVTIGGLVGRNRNGGRIHSSYYAGAGYTMFGHCNVGGLVGSQDSGAEGTASEIRNSYVHVDADVQLREVSCANPSIGGLVGAHISGRSIIANSYANGRAYATAAFSGDAQVTVDGVDNVTVPQCNQSSPTPEGFVTSPDGDYQINIAGLLNYDLETDVVPTNSYWRGNPYACSSDGTTFRYAVTQTDLIADRRMTNTLRAPTAPSASASCSIATNTATAGNIRLCTTYEDWNSNDWDFGNNTQFALLRYTEGADRDDPGCDFDTATSLPECGAMLPGQPRTQPVSVRTVPIPTADIPQAVIRYALNDDALSVLNTQDIITLDEGDTLRLDAGGSLSADNASLVYTWNQVSGAELLLQPGERREFSLRVRDDLVAIDVSTATLVLRLEVAKRNNRDVAVQRDVTINVTKTDNRGEIIALRWVENVLFAPDEILDVDGGPFTNVRYQWQREVSGRVVDIAEATTTTYKVPAEAIGEQYLLSISYTDGQGYSGVVSSGAPLFDATPTVDTDGDGLIEIFFIEQLNAIRYQPDGSAYRASADATPNNNGCPGSPTTCLGYELMADLDFDDLASYSDPAADVSAWDDWEPIGGFTAIFDGNGNTISNLSITASAANAGLFGSVPESAAQIRRVGLAEVAISGVRNTGALVGSFSGSSISDSHILSGTVSGGSERGCLVGVLSESSTIVDSSADCAMLGFGELIGGLVGISNGNIEGSYAVGNVMGDDQLGGLVGFAVGNIEDSYASGDVTGNSFVGGLAGIIANGNIEGSYASGDVTASDRVGGLVGFYTSGEINNSYAVGDVMGDILVGGLVGDALHSGDGNIVISNSHASGDVRGRDIADDNSFGGLVGRMSQNVSIANSYALGSVSSQGREIGGLVGTLGEREFREATATTIHNSYAATALDGGSLKGGLVGVSTGNAVISDSYAIGMISGGTSNRGFIYDSGDVDILRSYWDTERSGQSDGGSNDVIGFSSEILKSSETQSETSTTRAYYQWDAESWDFGTAEQYPALKYHDSTCGTDTPSTNCGDILPRQRLGLRDLQLRLGGSLQPQIPLAAFSEVGLKNDFDAVTVEHYTVPVSSDVSEILIAATTRHPEAMIAIDGVPVSAGSARYTFTPDLSTTVTVSITTSEAYEVTGKENLDVEYRLSFVAIPTISAISRSVAESEGGAVLSDSVPLREGHFVTLTSDLADADGDAFSYRWTVDRRQVRFIDLAELSGTVRDGSETVSLSFYLRDDFISAEESAGTVNARLTVRTDDDLVVSESLSLEVAKRNNGAIDTIDMPTLVGLTYTAPALSREQLAEDPDGAGDPDDIRYLWQQQIDGNWFDIAGATARSYTLSGQVADFYRVTLSYVDGQGYQADITSAPLEGSIELVSEVLTESQDLTITLVADGLMPGFNQRTTEYMVPGITTNVLVTVVSRVGGTISINEVPLPVGQNERIIPLNFGANEIDILLEGVRNTSQSYTITRDFDFSLYRWSVGWQGADAQTLDFPGSNLEPDPLPRIPNNIDTITVTATVEAMMQVAIGSTGNTVSSVVSSTTGGRRVAQATISGLDLGEHDVEFVLTAPDERTVSYTAKVWRRYNTRLISLAGAGLPSFDPETFTYTVPPLANHVRATNLNFQAHEGARVFVQGAEVSGNSVPIVLSEVGENTIPIRVTAPDEEDTVYTIDIVRQFSLNLRSLNMTDVAMTTVDLSPPFAAVRRIYDAEVLNETSQVRVTFATDLRVNSRLNAPNAPNMPTINETTILNNNSDDRIETDALVPLDFGENTITIMTSALGMQQVTTLTVVRPINDDDELTDLQLLDINDVNLLPDFESLTQDYVLPVSNSTAEVEVVATAHPFARIELDIAGDTMIATGTISSSVELGVGNQVRIGIVVTAQNGATSRSYTVLVTRRAADSTNVDLGPIGFEVDREGNGTYTPLPVEALELIPPETDDGTTYTAIITSTEELAVENITRIRISPRAADGGATVSINGGTAAIAPVLNVELNALLGRPEPTISIRVIQSGASETYSLIITRRPDGIRLRIKVFLEGPLQ